MLIDKDKIQLAKERLRDNNAHIIADILGLQDFDEKNLKACCPFHREDTPSFIYNKKAYSFHCFGACARSYDIIDAYISTGLSFNESVQKLFELAGIAYSFGEVGIETDRGYRYPKPVYADNNNKIIEYLAKRGISEKTINHLNLRQDLNGNILIQYYNTNDVLSMVKVRPSKKIEHGHTKIWTLTDSNKEPYGSMPILYNMNRVNTESPLVICSGEFDCAAAIEAGYLNATSIPMGDGNTQWVEKCWDFLEQFNNIIIVPDNDESGAKYAKNIVPRLGAWRCKVAHVPTEYISPNGDKHFVKDLNEALVRFGKDKVIEILTSAEDSPVPSVDNLSDIEDVDLDQIDGVTTGIKPLDKELMRFFYGTLTIVSGSPGSGKTSLLDQFICQALDEGVNTWVFSGELPEHMTKNWLNYILAGPRNVESITTNLGDSFYKVPTNIKNKINQQYNARWFVYKDDYDNNLTSLINSMTDVVRKYGVKFLILDNFMCIDSDVAGEELREQTHTIKELIKFSKAYQVATILVCHPRKLEQGSSVGIYDIAGTSNIINLAHRTISLRRITDEMRENAERCSARTKRLLKYDVVLTIIKDRMRGRSNIDIGLWYDSASRRFYTDLTEYDRQYQWDTTTYTEPISLPKRGEEIF